MRTRLESEYIGTHVATVAADQLIVDLVAVAIDIVAGRSRNWGPFRVCGFQPAFGLVHRYLSIRPSKTEQRYTNRHPRGHF